MLFKPASLLALAFALSSVAALRADLAPTAPAGDIEKRGLLNIDNVLCGIGLLGACVSTQTDVRNCGQLGFACPTTYINGLTGSVSCAAGRCFSACAAGFAFSTAAQACIQVQTDIFNCGGLGTICPSFNGFASCSAGLCSISACSSGFELVNGVCQLINYLLDNNNCGGIGLLCRTPSGASSASCLGGSCVVGGCLTGFTVSASGTVCAAVDVKTDVNNCGAFGRVCPGTFSNGFGSTCSNGLCAPVGCLTGYAFDSSVSICRTVTSDPNNCGSLGKSCSVPFGVVTCVASQCITISCISPYHFVNGICTTSASARARVKKSKVPKQVTLCPGKETACPITGSASFLVAQASGFSAFRAPNRSGLAAIGGYECLDTSYSIESCGGCASMGEGVNCLEAPHSSGVGCSVGTCVIFSCEAGYKPNAAATGCQKVAPTARHRRVRSKRSHASPHIH